MRGPGWLINLIYNLQMEKEFLEMIHKNNKIIYKVVSFYANAESPSKDLYQEVLINLWKGFPSFRGNSKDSTWIYRIALNSCISFLRKEKKRPTHVELAWDIPEYDNRDDLVELYNLIGRLGELERALVLLYLEEKSYQEISEITGLSVTNVATKLSRVKSKLKEMSNE